MNFTNMNRCHNFEIDENAWQKHDFNHSPLSKELHSSSAQEDQIGTIYFFSVRGKRKQKSSCINVFRVEDFSNN